MKLSVEITLAVLIGVACAEITQIRRTDCNLPMYTLDRECAILGGLCVDVSDCDPENLPGKGLCPSNRDKNVECCTRYRFSVAAQWSDNGVDKRREDKTCGDYKGTCMAYCNPLIRRRTKDCGGDFWCCILL